MTKTSKPPSQGVTREEFAELRRVVHEEVMPALKEGRERMDALATSDQELKAELKEEQMRTNERLARMDTKIDTIGAATARIAPFMESQEKVNRDLQLSNQKLEESNTRIEAAVATMKTGLGLNDGDGSESEFIKTMVFLREHQQTVGKIKEKAIEIVLYGFLALCGGFMLNGAWAYFHAAQPPAPIAIVQPQ